ncbi:exodeoxyribonuclease VII large subunit [Thalassorhabdomicrobium marinisediminis]|uniref:Exodeoxyribonuclease 7 large subunit n=1 Tax=Thalassorhabdomicrobium marinisediminis TaxID=2170577 RepID=A0A2T7FXL1_9RHOB|nr:exodeoxyribonuclease VII large subunit [Thalassorhabdomicrobium marinisediminis]PVA06906.1 exodeoxyribonuclease VII large subunit [Thalassorhabdomicrobium marinisediminis]
MDLIDEPQSAGNTPEFTVSELSGAVKRTIEGEFGHVRVKAEVGRVVRARSGHLYFDLKDDRNVLACTTWKGQVSALSVIPEEGMEVVVSGRMTTFGSQSKYQLNATEVAVAGVGALMAMLDKRKKALAAEGLFAAERKRPLPFLPEVIGVITSPTGAVIRDILHRLKDRFPRKVLVWPVAVQGKACAPQVAQAIARFNAMTPGGALPRPDLIIVARGGGSIEDLWGFNEEDVARAAAASDIPLISAVGHETDTTLIDYVSDRRAPTPSAAAEMAVPVRLDLLAAVDQLGARAGRAAGEGVTRRKQRVADLWRVVPKPAQLTDDAKQRYDYWSEKLDAALIGRVTAGQMQLGKASGLLRPTMLGNRLRQNHDRLTGLDARLGPALARSTTQARRDLAQQAGRLRPQTLEAKRAQAEERLTGLLRRLSAAANGQVDRHRHRLDGLDRMRETLGYRETLKRGYAVVRGDGAVVTTAKAAKAARSLEIEFADGTLRPDAAQPVARAKPSKPKPPTPEQGDLF